MTTELPQQGVIVVIDDDYAIRLSCSKILTKAGFEIEAFEDGAQGLEGVARLKPDLIVVDLKMPGISGMEVVSRVHQIDPQIIIIVITGYATIGTAVEAIKSGAYDFLPKPFSPEELRLVVRRGLERRHLSIASQQGAMEREILKRRFITFVSHQLQTPLVAIHQYLDVLRQLDETETTAAKRREWYDRCLSRTEEMQSLIKDWLTLAKVEGSSFARELTKVDLRKIIPGILNTYRELAASEQVTLETQMPEESYFVRGDKNCLSVLFDNLIVNAIKYNKPGGRVTVIAETMNGEVTVSVSDTGIGIPDEYQQLLFHEFFRVEREGSRKTTGTGLGLAICRRMVSEVGGIIDVESKVNEGSTFRVRLLADRENTTEEH